MELDNKFLNHPWYRKSKKGIIQIVGVDYVLIMEKMGGCSKKWYWLLFAMNKWYVAMYNSSTCSQLSFDRGIPWRLLGIRRRDLKLVRGFHFDGGWSNQCDHQQ